MCRLYRLDQRLCNIVRFDGPIVDGYQGLEQLDCKQRHLFDKPSRLLQGITVAGQQGRARYHEGVKADGGHRRFHLAFDAIVKNFRCAVGTHGADNAQTRGAGGPRRAGYCHHCIEIDRAKR